MLKSRLAAAEQQLSEHQRRDAESRAEINQLTAALTAARAQHERELEAAARAHQVGLVCVCVSGGAVDPSSKWGRWGLA